MVLVLTDCGRRRVIFIAIYCVTGIVGRSNASFEVNLKNWKECGSPQPPYPKERLIITAFKIHNQTGKTLMDGQHKVLAETPFQNFSAAVHKLDNSGKDDVLLFMDNLSCHSWIGRSYLTFSNIRYFKKDCRVRKGVYGVRNLDMNTILHIMPNPHEAGTMFYRVHLIHNSSTVFCNELLLSIE